MKSLLSAAVGIVSVRGDQYPASVYIRKVGQGKQRDSGRSVIRLEILIEGFKGAA